MPYFTETYHQHVEEMRLRNASKPILPRRPCDCNFCTGSPRNKGKLLVNYNRK